MKTWPIQEVWSWTLEISKTNDSLHLTSTLRKRCRNYFDSGNCCIVYKMNFKWPLVANEIPVCPFLYVFQHAPHVLDWLGPKSSHWESQHGWEVKDYDHQQQTLLAQWLNNWLPQQSALLCRCLPRLHWLLWLRWKEPKTSVGQWFGETFLFYVYIYVYESVALHELYCTLP